MYSKAEGSALRRDFWTAFGQYMQPVSSAEDAPVNWLNYKTGEKGIGFRMQADNTKATIAIELSHKDEEIRQLYFEKFEHLKKILFDILVEEWIWKFNCLDDFGKSTGRIYAELNGVNIYNKNDWSTLISFFKPRIIALDIFWTNAKYSFEALR